MLLHCRRDDGAPHFAGLPPASSAAQREKYAAISKEHDKLIYDPVKRHLNESLARLGVAPVATDLFHAMVALPDAYLQLTVPGFEFPRRKLPASVHFIGTPPIIPGQAPLPPWAHELDGSRKVVLVTQGTLSNFDFSQLVEPTLEALANEPGVLVVITTGGRPVNAIRGPVPTNARLATYLPFEWLLPQVDVCRATAFSLLPMISKSTRTAEAAVNGITDGVRQWPHHPGDRRVSEQHHRQLVPRIHEPRVAVHAAPQPATWTLRRPCPSRIHQHGPAQRPFPTGYGHLKVSGFRRAQLSDRRLRQDGCSASAHPFEKAHEVLCRAAHPSAS